MAAWKLNKTVGGVLALFVFIYITVVFSVIVPWLSYSVPGVGNWLLLTINTLLALGCFLACVLADPGSVPQGWTPSVEGQGAVVEVKRKGGDNRFCQKCKSYKPPRSHHCRVCKKCILRMDHHCPWINNCVGHANYKSFFLFLIYVNAAVIHAMGLLVAHAAHQLSQHSNQRRHAIRSGPDGVILHATTNTGHAKSGVFWASMQALCTAVTVPLTLALLMLLCWNVYLMITNRTTIEYYEGVTAHIQASRHGQQYQHPYDLGLCGNLYNVFGPNAAGWMVPGLSAFGDGLAYVTAWDHVRDDVDSLLGF